MAGSSTTHWMKPGRRRRRKVAVRVVGYEFPSSCAVSLLLLERESSSSYVRSLPPCLCGRANYLLDKFYILCNRPATCETHSVWGLFWPRRGGPVREGGETDAGRNFCWWIMWATCRYSKNLRIAEVLIRLFRSFNLSAPGWDASRAAGRPWEIPMTDWRRFNPTVWFMGQWLRENAFGQGFYFYDYFMFSNLDATKSFRSRVEREREEGQRKRESGSEWLSIASLGDAMFWVLCRYHWTKQTLWAGLRRGEWTKGRCSVWVAWTECGWTNWMGLV